MATAQQYKMQMEMEEHGGGLRQRVRRRHRDGGHEEDEDPEEAVRSGRKRSLAHLLRCDHADRSRLVTLPEVVGCCRLAAARGKHGFLRSARRIASWNSDLSVSAAIEFVSRIWQSFKRTFSRR